MDMRARRYLVPSHCRSGAGQFRSVVDFTGRA